MPVYFFDTEINGQIARDDEGIALPDLKTAQREATVALYGLASEVDADLSHVHAALRIRDGVSGVLLALDMKLDISPQNAPEGA